MKRNAVTEATKEKLLIIKDKISGPGEPPLYLDVLTNLGIEVFRCVLCTFVVAPALQFVISIPSKLNKTQRASVESKRIVEGTPVDGVVCLPSNQIRDSKPPSLSISQPVGKWLCNMKDFYIEIPEFLRDVIPLDTISDYSYAYYMCPDNLKQQTTSKNETNVRQFSPKNYWVHQTKTQQKTKPFLKHDDSITHSISSFSDPNLGNTQRQKAVISVRPSNSKTQLITTYQNFSESESLINQQSPLLPYIDQESDISGPSNTDKGPQPRKYDDGYGYYDRGSHRKYYSGYSYYERGPKKLINLPSKGQPTYNDRGPSNANKRPPRNYDTEYSYYDRRTPPKRYEDDRSLYSYDYRDKGTPPKQNLRNSPNKSVNNKLNKNGKGPGTYTPSYRHRVTFPMSQYSYDERSYYDQPPRRYGGKAGELPKVSRSARKTVSTSSVQISAISHPHRSSTDHNITSLPTTTISTMSDTGSTSLHDVILKPIKRTEELLESAELIEDDEF